ADERVENDTRFTEHRKDARRGDQHAGSPRKPNRRRIGRTEIDGIGLGELPPGEWVTRGRRDAVADHRDGTLAGRVHERYRPALRLRSRRRFDAHPEARGLRARAAAAVVVPERGVERARAGELGELDRRHATASGGLLPGFQGANDLTRGGNALDAHEV